MKLKPLYYFLAVVAALVLVLSLLIKPFVRKKIDDKLSSFKSEGLIISYEELSVDLFTRRLEAANVKIAYRSGLEASVEHVQVKGVSISGILFDDIIDIQLVSVDKPVIRRYHKPEAPLDASTEKKKDVYIESLVIKQGYFVDYDSIGTDSTYIDAGFRLNKLSMINSGQKSIVFGSLTSDSILLTTPYYTMKTGRLRVDSNNKEFSLDTLSLMPHLSRKEFSQKKGMESDQFTILVSKFTGTGMELTFDANPTVTVNTVEVKFFLKAFRDKRLPDNTLYKPLPIERLTGIPFNLRVDTVRLEECEIVYEEIGEEADASGSIDFKHLNAVIKSVSSDSSATPPSLTASAKFMNMGDIAIHGTLSNTEKPSYLEGHLVNFPIGRLNDMLIPHTGIRIDEGNIARMNFNFWFNNDRSDGAVELSYEDLKVVKLKDGHEKNDFVSFLLNLLIKRDKGKWVTGKQNPGVIMYYRDKEKGLFNFWWKSIFSGVKSSFLDDRKMLAAQLKKYEEREKN